MPKRRDLKKILVIGSGPIQIGQACEFDYSGTQAVRALRAEGYQIVLVNSNPATIMTDPGLADRTYIEPLVPEVLQSIIEQEKPDALLATLGGQVALNLAMELHRRGILEKHKVEMLGASIDAIDLAEDRERFRDLMKQLSLPVPDSIVVSSLSEGLVKAETLGFPLVLRPSFTLGGTGGGIVFNRSELGEKLSFALQASPVSQVLLEESIVGWKEIEFEVMRDGKDQLVIVCAIENCDPMGVHTGDSITVAPVQTLTDKEFQRLREACKKILRGVGIETGGCNVQFALDPKSDRYVVIEMNPRVSRSSALASKATGFPVAKLAALVAVGYSLDEIQNDITKKTPALFEPALDYIVVKIPRFAFEKFKNTEPLLGTQMKSVGEVMALGRTFKEAFQKALNSLELGICGLMLPKGWNASDVRLENIRSPRFDRWWLIAELFRSERASVDEVAEATGVDRWFLREIHELVDMEKRLAKRNLKTISPTELRLAKAMGFSDYFLSLLWKTSIKSVRHKRHGFDIHSQLYQVDTCAGEFEAVTPYYYFGTEEFPGTIAPAAANLARESSSVNGAASADGTNDRYAIQQARELASNLKNQSKGAVVILGSGPNRIGQGVEFDYCCVKAAQAVQALGYEAVMVNCNPETVSTDYDISSRLYFEPLEEESVRRVLHEEKSQLKGILCQTGGQTALKLSQVLKEYPILGTASAQIDRAEDRGKFDRLLQKLKLKRPKSRAVKSLDQLPSVARVLGYPVLIRPSYVLGGRSMMVLRYESQLERVMNDILNTQDIQFPLLVDRFLEDAIEIDVDCIGDGNDVIVIAIMEHIEEAGIHSGDSSCSIPTLTLSDRMIDQIRKQSEKLGRELKLCGFLNIQFAIHQDSVYVLEVNPRASRTLPFVCKATGIDWVQPAVHAMLGKSFQEQGLVAPSLKPRDFTHYSVKEVVFPFLKFPNTDVLLGPEMKSTGEVMGIGADFNEAFVKGLLAAGNRLPREGQVFVSVKDDDKERILDICQRLKGLGFRLLATHGTAEFLSNQKLEVMGINKVKEGQPHIVDAIINGDICMVINTTDSEAAISDSFSIRRSALQKGIPYFTTLTGARAAVNSLFRWMRGELKVRALQDLPVVAQNSDRQSDGGSPRFKAS